MAHTLKFLPSAKKEWECLDNSVKAQFKAKLIKCLENPQDPANRLRRFEHAYKIKFRAAGYTLVYEEDDDEIIVFVIAVSKRENSAVYSDAQARKTP